MIGSIWKASMAESNAPEDASAQVIWQVYSEYDSEGNPFTNISVDDLGNITAYRWDGGLYFINGNTGFAKPQKLIK